VIATHPRPAPAAPGAPGRVEVRPAADGDAALLYALYRTARWEEFASTGLAPDAIAALLAQQWGVERATRDVDYPGHVNRVVLLDGAPVGRAHVHRSAERLLLLDLLLVPAARNRGIGTHLLVELSREAAAAGLPLVLHVERWNPALRLYTRLGFTVRGESELYLEMERTGAIVLAAVRESGPPLA
jgi:GNAT superfamily N-acetyltransferase